MVELVLFACFAVYLVMGLTLSIMGGVYMSEVGEIADTGVALFTVGIFMLLLGAAALHATYKQIWIVLLLVELINIVLFLALYVVCLSALMLALGVTDPVRDGTEETWEQSRPELEAQKYCQEHASNAASCASEDPNNPGFYVAVESATDLCPIKADTTPSLYDAHVNCTVLSELVSSTDPAWKDCARLAGLCDACNKACMESAIADVKDNMEEASVTTLGVCAFTMLVVLEQYSTRRTRYWGSDKPWAWP